MTKIIDSAGKGAAIDAAENDANLSSLSGINAPITATSHTIDVDDQNDTIEYSNVSAIAVTLPTIASVTGANLHTDDFKVTLKNINTGVVTVTRGGTDTFEDGSTSKTLNQYDCITIQSNSDLTKWNILTVHDATYATTDEAETLENKTINDGAFTGTQTGFSGNVTGNLTGNVTGDVTGNADTVTTNANLTGDVTSVGNATTIQADVVDNSMLVSPAAGGTVVSTIKGSGDTVNTTNSNSFPSSAIYQSSGGQTIRIGTVLVSGIVRVSVEIKTGNASSTWGMRILGDGAVIGTDNDAGNTNTTYGTYNLDVNVTVGMTLVLQFVNNGVSTTSVRGVQVKSDTANMAIA